MRDITNQQSLLEQAKENLAGFRKLKKDTAEFMGPIVTYRKGELFERNKELFVRWHRLTEEIESYFLMEVGNEYAIQLAEPPIPE